MDINEGALYSYKAKHSILINQKNTCFMMNGTPKHCYVQAILVCFIQFFLYKDGKTFWLNGQYNGTDVLLSNDDVCNGECLDTWAEGEPTGDGECVEVSSSNDFKWNDRCCTDRFYYICKADLY